MARVEVLVEAAGRFLGSYGSSGGSDNPIPSLQVT